MINEEIVNAAMQYQNTKPSTSFQSTCEMSSTGSPPARSASPDTITVDEGDYDSDDDGTDDQMVVVVAIDDNYE